MNSAPFLQLTTSVSDITKVIFSNQIELCEIYAKAAEGTPVASFFNAGVSVNRAALEGFETVSDAMQHKSTLQSKDDVSKPLKTTADAMKKAVDAQADLMVDASAAAIKATAETQDVVSKVAKKAATGDVTAIYDDLTAVTGIGPATMEKLQSEGIRTIADLATTSSKELKAVVEKTNVRMMKYSPADWISDAKALMKAAKAA